jgi:hypothetical protein
MNAEAYPGELDMLRGLAQSGLLTITAANGRTTYHLIHRNTQGELA